MSKTKGQGRSHSPLFNLLGGSMNLFNEINRVTNQLYGGHMREFWYYALDKKGRRLGLIHAKNEVHAMEKARHEFGLAVIEIENAEEENDDTN